MAHEKLTSINFFLSYNLNSCFKSFIEILLTSFMIRDGIKTVMTVYNPMLKFSEILTFINIAIAKRKFEIIHIIKYLLSSSFPLLFVDNRMFARSMGIVRIGGQYSPNKLFPAEQMQLGYLLEV